MKQNNNVQVQMFDPCILFQLKKKKTKLLDDSQVSFFPLKLPDFTWEGVSGLPAPQAI